MVVDVKRFALHGAFQVNLTDDGSGGHFESDEALGSGAKPTKYVTCIAMPEPPFLLKVEWTRWRFENTNDVTHQLHIFDNAYDLAFYDRFYAKYSSAAGLLKTTTYVRAGTSDDMPFFLMPWVSPNIGEYAIYFKLDYSGVPGNTPGFLELGGLTYKWLY